MKFKDFIHELEQDPEYLEEERKQQLHLDIADAVIRARINKNWTQQELASKIGTKQANISRIESGLANPTIDMIRKLFMVLDINWVIFPTVGNIEIRQVRADSGTKNKAFDLENWPQSCATRAVLSSTSQMKQVKVEV